jgi:Ca-activated chloride channel homolog
MKIRILIALFFILPCIIFAENITITQIDTSSLLSSQVVKVYLSITDNSGQVIENLDSSMFTVYESVDGENYTEIEHILNLESNVNVAQGINFFLLIDNSGSMYYTIQGKEADEDAENSRIALTKGAIKDFINSMTNSKDSVSLGSFNTFFKVHASNSTNRVKTIELLNEISKPNEEEEYTELYAGLVEAVEQISNNKGRRVVIVLSDGKNEPYFTNMNKEHSEYGDKLFEYTEPIDLCMQEGVTIFAINYGRTKDSNLNKIALETGGLVFDASSQAELSNIYKRIRDRVNNEYFLTYKATMEPADKKYLKIQYTRSGRSLKAERFYFTSTIFGLPLKEIGLFLLIPLLAALLLWLILFLLKFDKRKKQPGLELLHKDKSMTKVSAKTIALGTTEKTVISGSDSADLTIMGSPTVGGKEATIMYDKKKDAFTIICEGKITVNNNSVSKKKLEAGDVINIGGTTLVFDDDIKPKKKKK